MSTALDALRRVNFDWVRTLDSVWLDVAPTGGPNDALAPQIAAALHDGARDTGQRVAGRVLLGQSGIGKTHLVGQIRREVWASGGWFVMLDVLGLTDFWRSAALSFVGALMKSMPDGRRQSDAVLAGVARRFNVERQVEEAFNTPDIDVRRIVDILVRALMRDDSARALGHQDVFRALCLLRAGDFDTVSLAHAWLQGYDADPAERAKLGFRSPPPAPVEVVRGLSWIMGLSGPTLVALDQIDGVVDASRIALGDDLDGAASLTEVLAAGLLELHDVGGRGMTVVTCLQDSWTRIEERGLRSAQQRFERPVALQGMNDRMAAAALIRDRLAPAYREAGFAPSSPTWPYTDRAIAEAAAHGVMPRTLLMRCDAFRRDCLAGDAVTACDSLIDRTKDTRFVTPPPIFDLDGERRVAEIGGLLDGDDGGLGDLLRATFDLYALEDDPDDSCDVASKGEPEQRIPPLHGRLTFTYRDENDRERHVCYRALQHRNAIAFQARLRAALTASGISTRIPGRELVLVRRGPVPTGAKTKQLFDAFAAAGGRLVDPSDDDLRTFVALRTLRERATEAGEFDRFERWLRGRQPLLATEFFRQIGLAEPRAGARDAGEPDAVETVVPDLPAAPEPPPRRTAPPAPPPAEPAPDAIPVGHRLTPEAQAVTLPLRLLPRHTAIIAGSGSGKTVLLRRLVEEAALSGIPAIVVDPNNDLSRLGDAWPETPKTFTPEDEAKAARYRAAVEVVVWTPGRHAGNPLFLSPLPDFAGFGDDRDEGDQAIEMAAETLGPLAGASKPLQKGVLAEALRLFAGRGGGNLADLTALLADLPEGVSRIGNAQKLAAAMADQLYAAVATNPLLKVEGAVLDPALLFHGPDPARTRVSVVNLSGLASDAAREDFVNRLQMALFGWIKKNPSPRGMLYVVDEAQTFLPSGRGVPSLGSGIKLVAQGRKYGLGMIVATQVPRGIHNQIVSNCTTQFFGRQSAPATISAAQEIMAANGGSAADIGRLAMGEFYFSTENSGRPAKLRTPLCLSHHPANPPTPEEVAAQARRSAIAAGLRAAPP
ncbi:ATP-binding protein [Methylobacterium oryzihabitans]|uniref:DUF853 family protein n=1 Tax=Methylobacterium oryzihabitans TaxID=2499852 RepID=A0A437NW83_9HYPH|nr:ATP-binding protein [Methylobacterium oryzihabitans]RVU14264.1 DUF853 family protein [Methylobacterium oryzihabitans]